MSSKDKKNWLYVIIGVLIVIIILLLLRSCGANPQGPIDDRPTFDLTEDGNAVEGGIEGKTKEEIQAELNEKVAAGMINISMNLNPVFADGESEGNLLIVNEKSNNYTQVVEIYLDETEELVYKSGLIPVGSKVESAKLDVDLGRGEHACTAFFNAVNPDTGELIGKAGAKIKIIVQN